MIDAIIRVVSVALTPVFFVGMAGSAVVVLITIMHDVRDFFTSEETPSSAEQHLPQS